jgi:DNA helicase-2/ATP-dependent DNA helicase PcrA
MSDLPDNLLIVANPGTGKTTRLAERVVELLKAGVPESEILCITFTTKAAQEMRDRIDAKIKESGLTGAKPHDIAVHTFHSYALDYLTSVDREYDVIGNNAIRYSIYKSFEANKALNYSTEYIISDIVPKTENAIRYLKSFGILPDKIDLKKAGAELGKIYVEEEISNITLEENIKFLEYFKTAFNDYEKMKPKGTIDYNDMLIRFIDRYDKSKRHYKHVLVDELQDVNELEASIAIESGDTLFLVGDRKQSIFGFQGGSTRNFGRFTGNGTKTATLTTNYRSTQQVIDYAKKHFLDNTKDSAHARELTGLRSNRPEKGVVQVVTADKPENQGVKRAMELASDKGTTAIITRTNSQLLSVSRQLDAKGVEYSSTISNATSDSANREITAFLHGVLYDTDSDILAALLTPFSGVTLKDAFLASELMQQDKRDDKAISKITEPFYKIRERASSLAQVQKLFPELIIPICMSISKDYFITATAITENVKEFFESIRNPTRDDLFHYLAVTEESYEPIGKPGKLVLTTVHKAKGLEFDNVIYLPKETREKFSFVDAVVCSIIKSVLDIDIRDELEEERLRVDFVAFTRARDNLIIIANPKTQGRYFINGLCSAETVASDDEPEPIKRNYDKAYSLFVAGRYDKAREALKVKDEWLQDLIAGYFGKVDRISYTLIDKSKDPYDFLKGYILRVPEVSVAFGIGSRVHEIAEVRFKGTLKKAELTEDEKKYLDNIEKIDHEIEKQYGAKQIAAEERIEMPLSEAFGIKEDITFNGIIDAVYGCKDGRYLIIDYKTDKTTDYAGDHRKQLAVYKRLYSKKQGIDESRIEVAIAYLGLRGKVNTGRLDCMLETKQPTAVLVRNFEKDVLQFAMYKKKPELFEDAVREQKNDEMLYEMVKRELSP